MDPGVHRDPQLRAHTIRPADEHWILIPRRLQVKHTSEPTDLGIRTATTRRPDIRLDVLDERIARVDVDAGLCVGETFRRGRGGAQCSGVGGSRLDSRVGGMNVVTDLWAMSRLYVFPSKSTLSTAAYAASRASRSVGAWAATAITRPPDVFTTSSDWVVPAWKTTVSDQRRESTLSIF